jgi:hypothetical protein
MKEIERMTTAILTRLYEKTLQLTSPRVDRENGVIRGVRIIGRISKNGREYSDKALRQLAEMYEGISVNIDHPSRHEPGRERGVSERFGELRNITKRANGIFGDLHYSKSHSLANHVADLAEGLSSQLGLSHNAEGTIVNQNGRNVVESVERVLSVDLVTEPATNAGLFESRDDDKRPPIDSPAQARLIFGNIFAELAALVARDTNVGPKETAKAVDELERAKGEMLKLLDQIFPRDVESGGGVGDSEAVAESYEQVSREAFPDLRKPKPKQKQKQRLGFGHGGDGEFERLRREAFPNRNR